MTLHWTIYYPLLKGKPLNLCNCRNLLPSLYPIYFSTCLCWVYACPWAPQRSIYRDVSSQIFSDLLSDSHHQIVLHVNLCMLYTTLDTSITVWSSLFSLWEVSGSLICFCTYRLTKIGRKRTETLKSSWILGSGMSSFTGDWHLWLPQVLVFLHYIKPSPHFNSLWISRKN